MVAVVLAGGGSRRFGRNKALELFRGERLLDRQVRILGSLFPRLLVITNQPELYLDLNVTVVQDMIPGQGPLGGIYTGLVFAQGETVFVSACDMPFVQSAVIGRMVQLAGDYDVVIPERGNRLEPLRAVYSCRCLPHIKRMLDRQEFQVISFFSHVTVYRLCQEEIDDLDPMGLSFFNINIPEDLVRAEELAPSAAEYRGFEP
ncbi:MAG: molybdenum cofactor guanylyltransferase [Syntrophobacteria bacterium]